MATATPTRLLTAEEYAQRPDPGHPEELVRGEIVPMAQPGVRHGEVCNEVAFLLWSHVRQHDLGRILTNDTGVITERGPDTVRGADVAYYSFERLPKGPGPEGYAPTAPDLVVEVRSPSERWIDLHEKVGEYLKVGVRAVIVLEPEGRTAHVFTPDAMPQRLGPEDELAVPEILGELRVPVARFFP
jgi:Uma2 family endonuclease